MLSFTLIILKDPTLLNSIADYTAQKITWPVQNGKTKEYNSNWFASKIHTDKKISETIKVISEQQCLWEDLEYTLTNKVDTSHALIVKQGNIVDNDLFPDFILNTIGYDDVVNYSLIGHILDKKERYYNLHNQMFLINVEHWKKVGSPTFDKAKNVDRIVSDIQSRIDTTSYEVMGWKELMPDLVQGIEIDNLSSKVMIWILYAVIGFGMFGGVFSPALFVGAAAGAICGRIIAALGIIGAAPTLAICGMAAVASAVIGAPVSGVVIILEMTMSYEFALAALISIVVAIMVSNLLFGHSFFDRQLLDRGINVAQGRGHIEMMETPVVDIIDTDFPKAHPEALSGEVVKLLAGAGATEAYLIDKNGKFLGKVGLHGLISVPANTSVAGLADTMPILIKHDASLQQAIEVASQFVGESIPVVNRDTGEMLGIVTEADLFQLYLSLQTRVADLERA